MNKGKAPIIISTGRPSICWYSLESTYFYDGGHKYDHHKIETREPFLEGPPTHAQKNLLTLFYRSSKGPL